MKLSSIFCLATAIIMDILFLRCCCVIGRRSLLQIDMQLQLHYAHPDMERMARISYKGVHKSVLPSSIWVKGTIYKREYAFT